MSKRIGGIALLLACAVWARDPDAASADAFRWPDPRGTPSGALRSRALPATGTLADAWTLELPADIVSAPVLWEGRIYLLGVEEEIRYLFAVDLFSGRLLARKRLGAGPVSQPVVWEDRVILRIKPDEYGEFKRVGDGFNHVWTHRPDLGTLSDPVVFESEIYAVAGGELIQLRSGRNRVRWKEGFAYGGRPAVYGGHVYVLGEDQVPGFEPSLHLFVHDRRTGRPVAKCNVAWPAVVQLRQWFKEGEITVGPERVYIRAPAPLAAEGGAAPYASVAHQSAGGTVRVGEPVQLHGWTLPPAVHRRGAIALNTREGLMWLLWHGDSGAVLAERQTHPDLFRTRVPATVIGDVVYFGTWAADVETLQILWRLPIRDLRYPLLPVDHGVLAVEGWRTLHLLRERKER